MKRGYRWSTLLVMCGLALIPGLALSQTGTIPPSQREVLFKQHQADFDYLLGDWEFAGIREKPDGSHFKLRGYVTALRFSKGATILVQDRFLNADGSIFFQSSTIMSYNAALDQWETASTDDGGFGVGLQDRGIAHRVGNEVRTEQHFATMTVRPTIWRIRHYDIQPNSYSLVADRSLDGGATWRHNYEQVQLQRIGPPRTLAPLITAK